MNIKRHLVLLTILVVTLTFASTAMAGDWVTLTSEEGKFSVLMPGPNVPEDKAETVKESATSPASAPYTSHIFTQTSDKGVIFLVGWTDYAPAFKPNAQAEMGANRDNFLKGVKAKLVSERAITLGSTPGIEFTGSRDDGMTFKARVYMVAARPYMLVALTPKGKHDLVNVERFFASFQFRQDWITFTSEQGKFSVLMPGPQVPKDEGETVSESKSVPAAAPYTTHLFLQTSGAGVMYTVGWVDYAPGFRPNVQGELIANRDNFLKAVKAKLTTEGSTAIGKNPGIEFTGTKDDGTSIAGRVYMVGPRPIMLVTLTPKGKNDSTNVEKFFASFKLK